MQCELSDSSIASHRCCKLVSVCMHITTNISSLPLNYNDSSTPRPIINMGPILSWQCDVGACIVNSSYCAPEGVQISSKARYPFLPSTSSCRDRSGALPQPSWYNSVDVLLIALGLFGDLVLAPRAQSSRLSLHLHCLPGRHVASNLLRCITYPSNSQNSSSDCCH